MEGWECGLVTVGQLLPMSCILYLKCFKEVGGELVLSWLGDKLVNPGTQSKRVWD